MSSSGRAWVRLAACAALLSFALLPNGHLRGHEEIATARAWVRAPASSLGAAPVGLPESPGRKGCSLCLSLARVRDALAKSDGPPLAVAAAAARLFAPRAERGPEAPSLPHACPRAPPSA